MDDLIRTSPRVARGMGPRGRRRVYVGLAILVLVLFASGMLAAYMSRNDTICADGQPPVAQRDLGLDQVVYRCQNGETVVK